MKSIGSISKWVAIGIATLVLAVGVSRIVVVGGGNKAANSAAVKIDNFSFGPDDVTIAVGTTITWTNRDDVPHVVASDAKLFKSKPLDTDDHFSFRFTKPGTYVYYCSIHPKMTAKVIVR